MTDSMEQRAREWLDRQNEYADRVDGTVLTETECMAAFAAAEVERAIMDLTCKVGELAEAKMDLLDKLEAARETADAERIAREKAEQERDKWHGEWASVDASCRQMQERATKAELECDENAKDVMRLQGELAECRAKLAMVTEALRLICEWQPPMVVDRDGTERSMAFLWGSDGERDHFREIARKCVDATDADVQAWLAAKRREWRIEGGIACSRNPGAPDEAWWSFAARVVDAHWPEDAPRKEDR